MIYSEIYNNDNTYTRVFDKNIDPIDLKWHRDLEDRVIINNKETNWLIQLDNQLPISIIGEIFIPKLQWHRVIKGDDDLEITLIKII